jgi:sulfatase modifying factor 1
MTFRPILAATVALLACLSPALAADPVVSNLTAAQRPGTKLVDIRYNLTADTPTVKVTLEISSDGGTTYTVPPTSATGAVGNGVAVGTGKTITWNAGVDWDGKFSPQTRFRVVADDLLLPAPAGFSGVSAGVDAFYIGRAEVTWSEWQTVRAWAAANGYDIGSVGAGTGQNGPVTNVNWYQTLKWCNARSEKEGVTPVYKVGTTVYRTGDSIPTVDQAANGYRLPSEKEWEFAALGGFQTNGYQYSGSNDIDAVAWHAGNSDNSTKDVATKMANELGIFDMTGNVWEWCFDDWGSSFSRRVVRGGGGESTAADCWVRGRSNTGPEKSSSWRGFRVARSLVP